MDQITYEERRRIAELVAEGAPRWKLHLEINRSRHAIRRAVIALHRPARREPKRSPLRLSPAEPLSWPRQHLLRATAAALVFAPVLVALIPASWRSRWPDSRRIAGTCGHVGRSVPTTTTLSTTRVSDSRSDAGRSFPRQSSR
jgi:hypothetical protein